MSSIAINVDQNKLIDYLLDAYRLKNDAALSRELEVAPPVISKIRHHHLPIGAALKIRMMEKFDITLAKINELTTAAA